MQNTVPPPQTPHLIITASDAQYGDFLIDHWLRSLQENVDLTNIEIAVIDYGLNADQRQRLSADGVMLHPGVRDGNVTNIRYREIASFLQEKNYDQVLAIDGGDIIFQADIRHLFEQDKESFRGVCEEVAAPFHDIILPQTDMDRADYAKIFAFLEGKPTINGGVIFGPAENFRTLWERFTELCRSFNVFGTDQLMINYLLYRDGFVRLDKRYNYVIVGMKSRFAVRAGVFYDHRGEVIPIVHNAGMKSLTRCIRNFGYGPDRNQPKFLMPKLLRLSFAVLNLYKKCLPKKRRPTEPSPQSLNSSNTPGD